MMPACDVHKSPWNRYEEFKKPVAAKVCFGPVKAAHRRFKSYGNFLGKRRKHKYREALERSLVADLSQIAVATEVPLDERFREQADKWQHETAHLSSPSQRAMHPSYQAILGMAQENKQEVVRLLLYDLQDNRREWFWALSFLTGTNPIKRSSAGKIDKMIADWVEWGKVQRLL